MIQVALSSPLREIGHTEGFIPNKSYFFDPHTRPIYPHTVDKEKEEKAVLGHIKSIQV